MVFKVRIHSNDDGHFRPTAQELLELPWLKGAKKASYLVDTLLSKSHVVDRWRLD